jgi:hypothetical protein
MKGRPVGSIIRNRIAAILEQSGTGYGYEIFKLYKDLFGKIHIRTIYYNLKKGIEKEEIIILRVENEVGKYSWGNEVQKIYYIIGPYANINLPEKDLETIKKMPLSPNKRNIEINWEKELKNMIDSLKKEINDYNEKYKVLSAQGKKLIKEKIIKKNEKLIEYFASKLSKEKIVQELKELKIDSLK